MNGICDICHNKDNELKTCCECGLKVCYLCNAADRHDPAKYRCVDCERQHEMMYGYAGYYMYMGGDASDDYTAEDLLADERAGSLSDIEASH